MASRLKGILLVLALAVFSGHVHASENCDDLARWVAELQGAHQRGDYKEVSHLLLGRVRGTDEAIQAGDWVWVSRNDGPPSMGQVKAVDPHTGHATVRFRSDGQPFNPTAPEFDATKHPHVRDLQRASVSEMEVMAETSMHGGQIPRSPWDGGTSEGIWIRGPDGHTLNYHDVLRQRALRAAHEQGDIEEVAKMLLSRRQSSPQTIEVGDWVWVERNGASRSMGQVKSIDESGRAEVMVRADRQPFNPIDPDWWDATKGSPVKRLRRVGHKEMEMMVDSSMHGGRIPTRTMDPMESGGEWLMGPDGQAIHLTDVMQDRHRRGLLRPTSSAGAETPSLGGETGRRADNFSKGEPQVVDEVDVARVVPAAEDAAKSTAGLHRRLYDFEVAELGPDDAVRIAGGHEGVVRGENAFSRVEGITHIGLKRTVNQDGILVVQNDQFVAGFVADGMGGMNNGEKASRIMLETTEEVIARRGLTRTNVREVLAEAIEKARANMVDEVASGGGTTFEGFVTFPDGETWVVHVGDSRTTLHPQMGNVQALTEDHSEAGRLAAHWRDRGRSTRDVPDQIATNVIDRPVGPAADQFGFPEEPPAHIDIFRLDDDLRPGDRIMVSSDGLAHVDDVRPAAYEVDAETITRLNQGDETEFLEQLTPEGIHRAQGKGKDNVGVVRLTFLGE